jgi:tetratricopeptide (TPR) repeat protein
MKGVLKIFKKKNGPTDQANSDAASQSRTESPSISLGLGDPDKGFLPKSKSSVLIVGLLLVAAGFFAYKRFNASKEDAVVQTIVATKSPNEFKSVAQLEPKDTVGSARKLFENSQIDESIEIYQKLLNKSPKDAQVLNDLGVLYLKRQKLKESENHLKRSVELLPTCSVCLNNLGYLKTLQGEDADAEIYLKKAIETNSEYIDPYFNLGVLYEKNGDIGRSVAAYAEFLQRSKDKDSPFNMELRQHIYSLLER